MSDDYIPDPGDPYGIDDPRNAITLQGRALREGEKLYDPETARHVPPRVIHLPRSNPAMNADNLPDAWKPKTSEPTAGTSPDEDVIPERESDEAHVLAAWYSGFSFAEHYRKVAQAQARELVRAQYALKGEKITESRLDDLARLHPLYLGYLERHLRGRQLWEREFLAMRGAA